MRLTGNYSACGCGCSPHKKELRDPEAQRHTPLLSYTNPQASRKVGGGDVRTFFLPHLHSSIPPYPNPSVGSSIAFFRRRSSVWEHFSPTPSYSHTHSLRIALVQPLPSLTRIASLTGSCRSVSTVPEGQRTVIDSASDCPSPKKRVFVLALW